MIQNTFIAIFGGVLGLLLLLVARPFIQSALVSPSEATHFANIEDFHRKMLERDSRDVKTDHSVSLRSIITPHPEPRIIYDLLPNQQVQFQGVPVRINNCGMRGQDVAVEKPAHVLRVLFLGDSFSFGWGVEEHLAFPAVTEQVLNRFVRTQDPNIEVEVLNMGVPGYSTFQQVDLFLERGADFRPDIVVVFFISNDFGLPFFISDVRSNGGVISGQEFSKLHSNGDAAAKTEHEKLVKMLDPNRAFRRLLKMGASQGFETYLAINPKPDWLDMLKRLWITKKSSKLHVLRLRERFLEGMKSFELTPEQLSLPNDPHPSAAKHALLGSLIAESLFPEVERIVPVL
ncbi:MAG: SGNH/GDSL hydrolase family protein [Bdellovibrionales bacterium]|nr:SGNH/GDSL hydrolase family protein [Bdellovibrionales bacterium]